MKKSGGAIIFLLLGLSGLASPVDTTLLKAKPVYGKEARVVSYLLDNNHYRRIHFNDSLSSIVFDAFFIVLGLLF